MKKNIGLADRMIRLIIAAVLLVLYFTGTVSGGLGIAALVVAGTMALTSFISFCPLYTILGFSTCPVRPVKK